MTCAILTSGTPPNCSKGFKTCLYRWFFSSGCRISLVSVFQNFTSFIDNNQKGITITSGTSRSLETLVAGRHAVCCIQCSEGQKNVASKLIAATRNQEHLHVVSEFFCTGFLPIVWTQNKKRRIVVKETCTFLHVYIPFRAIKGRRKAVPACQN